MADDTKLAIEFDDDQEVRVEFPDEGLTTSVPCIQVGDDLYELQGVPVGAEAAGYLDIIEAELVEAGHLRFRRVAKRSDWRTYDYLIPSGRIDTEWGQSILRELEARGGHWELVFGGLVFVCKPPGDDLDPTQWVLA